jgi:hypothetical protein
VARLRQVKRSTDPYDGVAQSVITSNIMFFGDATMITGSLTTSSGTASRWTIEGYEGDDAAGFRTAIPAASATGWQPAKVMTAQGYFSMDTIPTWARVLRVPSNSSGTLFISIHCGP